MSGRPGAAGSVDVAHVLIDGPWRHRYVAANGARFHVAEAGEGPLVLLLHGFPQFWWAWRHQLVTLAAAGYRAVAMDLRGFGASDKPPRGYDTMTLAADVAGVVRALGERDAVIAGHDLGAWIAWSMPALAPAETRAVAALSMAHPLTVRAALARSRAQRRAWRAVRAFQTPIRPERRLTEEQLATELLRDWSMRGAFTEGEFAVYQDAIRVPFVAHSSMEYYRWIIRSLPRQDGRRFAAAVRRPVDVPVLQLHGEQDPFVLPRTAEASRDHAGDRLTYEAVAGAGHYLPEEAPDTVGKSLLRWLENL
jgi:pimeloyl-ACP methyl ester carboxylesterase